MRYLFYLFILLCSVSITACSKKEDSVEQAEVVVQIAEENLTEQASVEEELIEELVVIEETEDYTIEQNSKGGKIITHHNVENVSVDSTYTERETAEVSLDNEDWVPPEGAIFRDLSITITNLYDMNIPDTDYFLNKTTKFVQWSGYFDKDTVLEIEYFTPADEEGTSRFKFKNTPYVGTYNDLTCIISFDIEE